MTHPLPPPGPPAARFLVSQANETCHRHHCYRCDVPSSAAIPLNTDSARWSSERCGSLDHFRKDCPQAKRQGQGCYNSVRIVVGDSVHTGGTPLFGLNAKSLGPLGLLAIFPNLVGEPTSPALFQGADAHIVCTGVVRLDTIAANLLSIVEAFGHDCLQGRVANVQPFFVGKCASIALALRAEGHERSGCHIL